MLPLGVCIAVAIVHSLLNFLDQIAVAVILIVNKIALGTILHSIFLEAGFSIGFYQESWKAASRLSLILICIWLVFIVTEVALSVSDADTKSISTAVLSIVSTAYENVMLLVYVVVVIQRKPGESRSPLEISRKKWRFRISIFLVLVLGTSFRVMAAMNITTIGSLPHYTVPAIVSVVMLICTAHFDRPVRTSWPRPRIPDYTLVLSLSFLWILPWILEVFAAFTKGLNTSSHFEGPGGFSVGFTLSLSWLLVSQVISLFFSIFKRRRSATVSACPFTLEHACSAASSDPYFSRRRASRHLLYIPGPCRHWHDSLGGTRPEGKSLGPVLFESGMEKKNWTRTLKKKSGALCLHSLAQWRSMYAKAVMIVLVILDMIFVSLNGEEGGDTVETYGNINNSSETLASLYSTPALTGKMHRLERWAMLSGFVVQFSFNFMGNDLIERYISYRLTKLARMLFATQAFLSGVSTHYSTNRKTSSMAESLRRQNSRGISMFSLQVHQVRTSSDHAKQVLRDVTRGTGGLGDEVLFLNAGGKKVDYTYKKHRDAVFKAKSSVMLIWSMYITSELILRFYVSRKKFIEEIKKKKTAVRTCASANIF